MNYKLWKGGLKVSGLLALGSYMRSSPYCSPVDKSDRLKASQLRLCEAQHPMNWAQSVKVVSVLIPETQPITAELLEVHCGNLFSANSLYSSRIYPALFRSCGIHPGALVNTFQFSVGSFLFCSLVDKSDRLQASQLCFAEAQRPMNWAKSIEVKSL